MNWKKDIPEKIEVIIVDYLEGNVSKESEQRLTNWLDEDINNRKIFDGIKNTWLVSESINTNSNSELVWNTINNAIKRKEGNNYTSHKKELETKFEIPVFLKIAASILIFYLLGGLSWHYYNSYYSKDSSRITEIKSPMGSKSSISLPDGTEVILNAGSTIRYAKNYGARLRNVYLDGEAFFDVVTNKNKPFVVNASSIKITALGTAFNVKAYEGEETVQTTLVEGKIKIENEKVKGDYLYLEPNQVAVFKKNEGEFRVEKNSKDRKTEKLEKDGSEINFVLKKSSVILKIDDPKPFISWKDDQLIVTGESLGELATKLERMFDVTFKFESDVVKNYSFNGTLEKETLDQVLNAIKHTAPIDYEIKNKRVILREDLELKQKYERLLE